MFRLSQPASQRPVKSKRTSSIAADEPGAPCKDYASTFTVLFDAMPIEMTPCFDGGEKENSF